MNRENSGAALVEVLVALLFLGLIATDLQQFARTMLRGVRGLEAATEAQEAARIATELIVRDLRNAGYGADGALANGIRIAAADTVEVGADLNGDGDTDDAQEVIGYRLGPDRRTLMRVMAGVPQPLLTDLGLDGLRFAYHAADGSLLSGPGATLDSNTRRRVRRIDVVVAVEIPHPDPSFVTPIRSTQTATVCLRNG